MSRNYNFVFALSNWKEIELIFFSFSHEKLCLNKLTDYFKRWNLNWRCELTFLLLWLLGLIFLRVRSSNTWKCLWEYFWWIPLFCNSLACFCEYLQWILRSLQSMILSRDVFVIFSMHFQYPLPINLFLGLFVIKYS